MPGKDDRLLGLVKRSWLESGTIYGYRKVTADLRERGEACGKQRVERLMSSEGLKARVCSMSRRGNCHDNAVAESFFQLLKRERVKRKIYPTRDHARPDVFDYIEMFCNPVRRHGNNQGLSPVEYEKQSLRHDSWSVYRSRGDST